MTEGVVVGRLTDKLVKMLIGGGYEYRSRSHIGPTFWNGKDLTGRYHDKQDLAETLKKIKKEKKRK